jgi:hypothetical protein
MENDEDHLQALAEEARRLEHATIAAYRSNKDNENDKPGTSAAYVSAARRTWPAYLRPLADPRPLAEAWPTIAAVAANRADKADIYAEALAGGPWRLFEGHRQSGVCWRFTLVLHAAAAQQSFTAAIRARGTLASNLYWPLCDLFRPEDDCPHARDLGRRVVNLCVDSSVSRDWVRSRAANVVEVGRSLGSEMTVEDHR